MECRYFSGQPAAGLPRLPRPDGSRRPDYEQLLQRSTARHRQYYHQYVRPATMRSFKQMQARPRMHPSRPARPALALRREGAPRARLAYELQLLVVLDVNVARSS